MSQTDPKYSEYEIAPKRDRRSPTPIASIPVHVLTDEVDPTQEIRTLINELQATARKANAQLQDIETQRDEAVRQRDLAIQRHEESNRRTEEAVVQLAAVQKQVLSIRQARDAAQAQNLAIASKLLRADDEIAELGYAREYARKAAVKAGEEAEGFCRQLDAVTRDRDAAIEQIGELQSELDRMRRKALDLAEQKSAVAQAGHEHATALAEARAQLLSVTQERDLERTRAQDQAREAEEARQQIAEFRTQAADATQVTAELEEVRRQLAALTVDRDLQLQRGEELLAETISQQDRLTTVTNQLVVTQRACQDALAHADRYEERRLQSIDLATQLEAVRRDLRKTSANLAEARLQIKFVQAAQFPPIT